MRNPRHQFILVGFLAQSLTWESYLPMFVWAGLWVFCLAALRGRVEIGWKTEATTLFLGCILSFFVDKAFNRTAHFFLGEGLIFLQAVRLIRPLNRREKLTSILIACFHLGVVCTLAPNVRFALIFLAAAALFPKALQDLQFEDFAGEGSRVPVEGSREGAEMPWPERPSRIKRPRRASLPGFRPAVPRFRLPKLHYLSILLFSALVFLAFPRISSGVPLFRGAGEQSLLDSILDPTRGGTANSERVLLQIDGERVGYLRCFSLTEFDGVAWTVDKNAPLFRIRFAPADQMTNHLSRQVRVKNSSVLGRVLPVDGKLSDLDGNFFNRAHEGLHGTIECSAMWNTANNVYTYAINPKPLPDVMPEPLRKRLTWHPQQTSRLQQWVERVSANGTNALNKMQFLEAHLQRNFTYKIGAPELRRLNPIDDFVFNAREGHCERFAAALALFMRMQNIPSRVVIGYVATSRNPFSGWHQVRFRDAHAWCEGYFDDIGWVQFDATPGPPPGQGSIGFADFMEALDFAWYSYVIGFDGIAQRQVFTALARALGQWPDFARQYAAWLLAAVAFMALYAAWRKGLLRPRRPSRQPAAQIVATHQYGRMLRLLHRHGWHREPFQTPLEYLENLRANNIPAFQEVSKVTNRFCQSTYGNRVPSLEQLREVDESLHRLEQALAVPRK